MNPYFLLKLQSTHGVGYINIYEHNKRKTLSSLAHAFRRDRKTCENYSSARHPVHYRIKVTLK